MTNNPEHFLRGDVVERTGETAMGVIQGRHYRVRRITSRGFLRLDSQSGALAIGGEWRAAGFKIIERPER